MKTREKVQFLVDDKGRRKSVLMSYGAYLELLEDLSDLQCVSERSGEEPMQFDEVVAELKDEGRL